jgi:hypothetical protein
MSQFAEDTSLLLDGTETFTNTALEVFNKFIDITE